MPVEAHNIVAGKLRTGEPFDVIDPAAFGTVVGIGHAADEKTVAEASAAAASAAHSWGLLPLRERISLVRHAVDTAFEKSKKSELAILLTREQGKLLGESNVEIEGANLLTDVLSALAEQAMVRETLKDERGLRVCTYAPIGPVAAITPWNWPVILSMLKVVSALLTGNPVILKPPPNTPLTITRILADMAEVLPPGVVGVLNGGPAIGAALTADPTIRKISFTGSSPNGRKVYAASADTLKSVTLELGGNDAAILLDDMDISAVLPPLLDAAYVTSGQVCWAVKRLYVPRARYAEVAEALCRMVDAFVIGRGLDPDVTLGPLNNRAQLDIVASLVRQAHESGATVHELGSYAPGHDPALGFFHRPAVVTDVSNDAAVVQEEQFGPVLPLVAYDDEGDAVRWANDTEYGLSASVWSADQERAFRLAERLDAGQVFVNCHGGQALDVTVGTGGIKQSGVGREAGVEGLREYLEPKIITSRVFA